MKQIVLVLIATIFFTACSVKEQTVDLKLPKEQSKKEELIEIKKEPALEDEEQSVFIEEKPKEEIFSLDPFEIVENYNPLYSDKPKFKVAFVFPSNLVASYGKTSINTILGYLSYVKSNYELKVYDSKVQDKQSLENIIEQIKNDGFEKVIALYTPQAIETLHTLDTDGLELYLPLGNSNSYTQLKENFIYGSISYEKQMKKLLEYSSINNSMFYQESYIGNRLKNIYENLVENTILTKKIKKERNYFKWIVNDERLNNSTLMLNTSLVKTALILSQLRAYEIEPSIILSTQLSFKPKLISLTQPKDRQKIVFASSIERVDDRLQDILNTYDVNINYDWVAYSVLVGVDYFYEGTQNSVIKTKIEDNIVVYEPKLYKTTGFGFSKIK